MLKPLRIDVRPLPRGSHASPIRGEKFSFSGSNRRSTRPIEAVANCSVKVSPGPSTIDDRRSSASETVPK
jgi:hypothetical protein